ncbi:MAG: ABC transporter permease [Chloroflexia bacterium]|nr:ABC transporter permease [Chloroflexia bacterium]
MTATAPHAALPRTDATAVPRLRQSSRAPVSLARVMLWIVVTIVLAYLVFPVFIVAPVSFSSAKYLQFPPPGWSLQWYENYLNRPGWVPATFVSIRVAVITTVLATTLGTAASLALVRGRFPGRNAINSFMVSPLVVPGIIVAIGIYFFYAQAKLVGNPLGLAFAHTALALPFVVTNVSATLHGFDERLEYAAMNLGANRWQTFRRVTLPIIRPGVFAGALFAFITSFDELIVALFVSGSGAVTLPRKMWDSLRQEIDPTIAAVSTILITLSVAILLTAELLRQRSERIRTATWIAEDEDLGARE